MCMFGGNIREAFISGSIDSLNSINLVCRVRCKSKQHAWFNLILRSKRFTIRAKIRGIYGTTSVNYRISMVFIPIHGNIIVYSFLGGFEKKNEKKCNFYYPKKTNFFRFLFAPNHNLKYIFTFPTRKKNLEKSHKIMCKNQHRKICEK